MLFEFKADRGKTYLIFLYINLSFIYLVNTKIARVLHHLLTEQVIDGLDQAVITMKKGEERLLSSRFHLSIYAFSSTESK